MNTMFQVNDYFVRIKEKAGRLNLTVWDNAGDKLLTEYVSAGSLPKVWNYIEKNSSPEVVEQVKGKLHETVN